MSNQIILCMNVFNEYPTIAQSLRSIIPYVDGVIIVDGAYVEFPMSDDVSSDGTVEAAKYVVQKEWNKKFTTISFNSRKTEVQKRTAYLEYIQREMDWKKTWAFIWDADFFIKPLKTDKEVINDFTVLRETEDVRLVTVNLTNKEDESHSMSHMIVGYRDIPGLHYNRNHFGVWDKSDGAVNTNYCATYHMNDTLVFHDRTLNPKDRVDARTVYYNEIRRKFEV